MCIYIYIYTQQYMYIYNPLSHVPACLRGRSRSARLSATGPSAASVITYSCVYNTCV